MDAVTQQPTPSPPVHVGTPWVDVLVPVLWRPHAAAPFMASFFTTTPPGMATVTVIADLADDETAAAWDSAGAHVIRWCGPKRGTFARKVNEGYRFTGARRGAAPWILLVGDDARFEPDWAGLLQLATLRPGENREDPPLVVYASNGLDRVVGAAPDVHPLIHRGYVDEIGASWDGPRLVCHEGYDHHYTDGEISLAAHMRGVRGWAPNARITHLHHLARTAPVDATYERGVSLLTRDRAHFKRRVARYAPDAYGHVVPPRPPDAAAS